MKQFWDARYAETAYAYGTEPNAFLKAQLAQRKPGKILFPAEGEGRNAVYAAQQGWEVSAFDQSTSGRQKAMALAAEHRVNIAYTVEDFNAINLATEHYDAVALIFAHFPPQYRQAWHAKAVAALKHGGILLVEAFSKEHLHYNSKNPSVGGPQDAAMLYDTATLAADFAELEHRLLHTTTTHLAEGPYHQGEASVTRFLGVKR
jgi:2-polyprenyl-3-methyl-5-hydroxy-6-metoxy-1,4-benzoquinol methylase